MDVSPPRDPGAGCANAVSSTSVLSGGTTPRHASASDAASPRESHLRDLLGSRATTPHANDLHSPSDSSDMAALFALGSERNRLRCTHNAAHALWSTMCRVSEHSSPETRPCAGWSASGC